MFKLDRVKRYYTFTLPVILLAFLLLLFSPLVLEVIIPYLLVYTFAVFLEHPNINTYRENPRKRLAFVSFVFSLWNTVNLKLPENIKYREKILTHSVGIIVSLVLLLLDFSLVKLLAIVLGVVTFELVFYLYIKLSHEDEL